MHLNKRSLISLSILVLILLTATVVPAFADTAVFVYCANGGAGENVMVNADIASTYKVVMAPDGLEYGRTVFTRRNASGAGEDTGNMYYGGGSYVTKTFLSAGPWGQAGTLAYLQDTWKLESSEVIATVTYTYMMDQNGVVQMDAV